jgi:SAM-dependent methyltransferase
MLKIARKGGLDVRLGRAEKLPFEDNSFDTVFCFFTVLNMCDYRKAAAEMARVLRPGGAAVISVASIWDRNHGLLKRLRIRHPAKDKSITIDGKRMRITLFGRKELAGLFKKNGMEEKKSISLFKFHNPRWGNRDRLSFIERLRLRMDALPVFGSYGAIYIMAFKKTENK